MMMMTMTMMTMMQDSKVMEHYSGAGIFPLFIICAAKMMIHRSNPTTEYPLTFKQLGVAFISLSSS